VQAQSSDPTSMFSNKSKTQQKHDLKTPPSRLGGPVSEGPACPSGANGPLHHHHRGWHQRALRGQPAAGAVRTAACSKQTCKMPHKLYNAAARVPRLSIAGGTVSAGACAATAAAARAGKRQRHLLTSHMRTTHRFPDLLVLEAQDRVGGRISQVRRVCKHAHTHTHKNAHT